ncbi:MAG: DUF4406 domain-containing protein [Tepidisphaeraceae bacterium]|jgi:hypothetical protein
MKLIYIAGPYRGAGQWQIFQNIRRAEALALQVWQMGAACICPHKNTESFNGAAPDRVWLDGDLEIVRRCDAILCAPGWESSSGSLGEIALARELGLPIFYSLEELAKWMKDGAACEPLDGPLILPWEEEAERR